MNELEFKRHLKELVHGHHHPEEHDWHGQPGGSGKPAAAKTKATSRRSVRKTARRK